MIGVSLIAIGAVPDSRVRLLSVMFQPMRSAHEPPDAVAGPSVPPPVVFCPTCARPLTFRGTSTRSVAAVDAAGERWNQYECRTCGRYEFRVYSPETELQQRG